MYEYTIYALRGDPDSRETIFDSLVRGEGRFGWSYIENADLRILRSRIETEGWASLTDKEKDCYQPFLLNIRPGDYVVYVNIPEYGKCTLARVTGEYTWRYESEDFNHRFPVDVESIRTFDRNDAVVHPALSARLKLQGRYWRIYMRQEFDTLVEAMRSGYKGAVRGAQNNISWLIGEMRPHLASITGSIHRTHPNVSLESLVAEVLRRVPGVKNVTWQGGAGDHGADVLVIFESGLPIPGLQEQKTCVVQVKSFENEHWDISAVHDIRRAFDHHPEAELGLIISTASATTEALEREIQKARDETGKSITLLIGPEVASFLLRFGGELFSGSV